MKRRREGRGDERKTEEEETSRRGTVDERMRNEEWSTKERRGDQLRAEFPQPGNLWGK
jgi:hypothetical protein